MSRRERTGVMLAKTITDALFAKLPDPVIVQPKLNGARLKAVWTGSNYELLSSTGLPVTSVPSIQRDLNALGDELSFPPDFDGEAYNHDMALQEIMSIFSKTTRVDEYEWMLSFNIFDIESSAIQVHRIGNLRGLQENFAARRNISFVQSEFCYKSEITQKLNEFMELGYEGIILRDPRAPYSYGKSSCILKLKPRIEAVFPIIGCQEAVSILGEPKAMVGAFDLVDSQGNIFQAGAGKLTHLERMHYWEHRSELKGLICHIKYLELTNRGVPREAVTIRISKP